MVGQSRLGEKNREVALWKARQTRALQTKENLMGAYSTLVMDCHLVSGPNPFFFSGFDGKRFVKK